MRVILLKLALAVAVSFTGFFYSTYGRSRRIIIQLPSPLPSEEDCKEADLHSSEKINACSCSSVEGNNEDGFLLPEFLDLINEFESSYNDEYDDEENEVELREGRNRVGMEERERGRDMELLEYYGVKEMESALMELQNRLRLSEIENLQLLSHLAAHSKTSTHLQSAMEEIKSLKKKIRSCEEEEEEEEEEKREHVSMFGVDHKVCDSCMQLPWLKDAENIIKELRKANSRLQVENSHLAKRIHSSSQSFPSSICDSAETGGDNGEDRKLVEENERLVKEVEQLVRDRREDVEELVYLRWLNACFRYELREYKPRSGKMAAKELSKARSPRSEAKVKQLIFDYSKSYPVVDFDFDLDFDFSPSSSQPSSIITDSDGPSTRSLSTRPKLFAGLRSILRGRRHGSIERRPKP